MYLKLYRGIASTEITQFLLLFQNILIIYHQHEYSYLNKYIVLYLFDS